MKKLSVTLSVLFLLSSACSLKASQDTTEININTTFVDYVNFTGTAMGVSKYYSIDDIQSASGSGNRPILSLGTLGLESNSAGNCDIEFSAKNDFKFLHTVTNDRLTHYRLRWKGEVMSGNPVRTNQFTMECNSTPTSISFQSVAYFNSNPESGVYQDVITVTVTTQ